MKEIVLITGATAGFGKACAEKFAENGHDLIIIEVFDCEAFCIFDFRFLGEIIDRRIKFSDTIVCQIAFNRVILSKNRYNKN